MSCARTCPHTRLSLNAPRHTLAGTHPHPLTCPSHERRAPRGWPHLPCPPHSLHPPRAAHHAMHSAVARATARRAAAGATTMQRARGQWQGGHHGTLAWRHGATPWRGASCSTSVRVTRHMQHVAMWEAWRGTSCTVFVQVKQCVCAGQTMHAARDRSRCGCVPI